MAAPIFQTYAPEYAAAGLTVFPVGGEDGKVPLVPYWPQFGPRSHTRFLEKFADANIGLVDGKEITRVDIDDPALIDSSISRFGDTPIKVQTPRGGMHLWYRANGERRQTKIDGADIDILGLGGFGVAPPSVHPSNGAYSFLEGGLGDLGRLPSINAECVPHSQNLRSRNTTLLGKCLYQLNQCPEATEEGILEWALEFNLREFDPPMAAAEVQKTAQSAWTYQVAGNNWVGRPSKAMITPEQWARLDPSSLHLYTYLVHKNGWRGGGSFRLFTTTARALVNPTTGKCWGRTRFTRARNRLIETGDLIAIDLPKQGERRPAIVALEATVPKWD